MSTHHYDYLCIVWRNIQESARHLCLTQVPQKIRTIITAARHVKLDNFQISKCTTAREGLKTEASAEHTSPFRVRTETTQQDSSPQQRRKIVKFVQNQALMQNMYPLSKQALPSNGDLPKNQNFCTPHATPRHRTRDGQITKH